MGIGGRTATSRVGGITRAFLFSDLRGYTDFVDRHGDRAGADLLEAYRRLVRDVVRRYAGAEIKTEGDSFYLVFPSVSSAVGCGLAIAAAADTATRERPTRPMRVAIGIHAGESTRTDAGYVGLAVNTAARICAVAGAGEILVSETVRSIARTGHDFTFTRRGRRSLKGIAEPVPLYAAELAAGASPIAPKRETPGSTLPGRQGLRDGVPSPLSSFIGRERELAELDTLLNKSRLVTLTGAGGSGKTRLGIQAARRIAERMGIGAAFVDLAPINDPDLVTSTIATALGVRAEPPRTMADELIEHLGAVPMLIVLDNLEQLLPAAAGTIADLMTASPELRVLATSRAPLHVRGEHQYDVDPLVQAEAVTLFAERARSVDSRFEVTEQNRAAIVEICRRLDGLPLAIELAAAASKLLTAEALLRRLDDHVQLPGMAPVDAPARQRTLRDTIAWSYGLLLRTDQVVLARLAGFVGGFTVPAAQATLPDPEDKQPLDVLASLDRLVDQNLVRVAADAEGEPRFNLLDTIREFCLDRLPPLEAERFRERHARFFVEEVVRRTGDGVAPFWPGAIADDLDNIRATLNWAQARGEAETLVKLGIAAWIFFGTLGHADEAGRWLHAAELASASAGPAIKAALLHSLASHELAFGGDRLRARDLLTQALRAADDGDAVRTIRILELLSAVAADLGDRTTAEETMRRAVFHTRRLEDPRRRAGLLAEIAESGHWVHELPEMKALAEEALRDGRAFGDASTVAHALMALGYVALAEGETSAGVLALSEAVALQAKGGLDLTSTIGALGIARTRRGELEASRSLLIDALRRAQEIRVVWLGLMALEGTADWLGAVGKPDRAARYWAAIDSLRTATLNRTPLDDMGFFTASRGRDRSALSPSAYREAVGVGKGLPLDDALVSAIQDLGETNVDHSRTAAGVSHGRHDLTAREHEVLQLLAAGRSDGQIAEELFISKKTAAVHVANIKGKLGAGSRVEIATMARDRGLVSASPNGQSSGR